MKNKRILSTKILNEDELNQLDLHGHVVEQWNFIKIKEKWLKLLTPVVKNFGRRKKRRKF